jgi:two-component system response regulator NreC
MWSDLTETSDWRALNRLPTGQTAEADASTTTIVLADDHRVVRSGLRMLLETDDRFEVVGEAGDLAGTEELVLTCHPDVLVLDLNMAGESSLGAVPGLRERAPDTQIVILTMQENPAFAREAFRAGARGYVLKDAADSELMQAIELAAAGGTYLNPQLGAMLATEPPEGDGRPDNLTPREIEVLKLIALGHTNGEIAGSLFLSVRTVESHRAHIQQKVCLNTRAELVAYVREHGLFD